MRKEKKKKKGERERKECIYIRAGVCEKRTGPRDDKRQNYIPLITSVEFIQGKVLISCSDKIGKLVYVYL